MNNFADVLKRVRKAKGLTQQWVAERAGIRKGYVSSIESAKVNPPKLPVLRKLARILGIDRTELILLAYIARAPREIRGILERSVRSIFGRWHP